MSNLDKDIANVQNYIDIVTVFLPKYSTKIPEKCIDEDTWLSIKNVLKELETKNKIINTAINYILNNTHIEHDGDDYGYTEWIEIDTDTTTFITTLENILKNEVLKDE